MEIADIKRVDEDIEGAKNLILHSTGRNDYDTYCVTFQFGTENQEGINEVVSYKDKDVLTIGSSGDQYLGAVYYEANKVDLYDINRLSKPMTYLKIASMLTLSYEDFLRFLIPTYQENEMPYFLRFKPDEAITSSFWNLKTLKKIIPNIPADVAYFWDNIMFLAKKNNYGDFIVPTNYISYQENVFRGMPFYSSEEEYYKLQVLLRKRSFPKFMESDLLQIGSILTDSYDLFYLSNIIGWLISLEIKKYSYHYDGLKDTVEKSLVTTITKEIMPYLNDNGIILFDYKPNSCKEDESDFLFVNPCFDVSEIPSKIPSIYSRFKDGETDLVLTYKPKEKGNILDILE